MNGQFRLIYGMLAAVIAGNVMPSLTFSRD